MIERERVGASHVPCHRGHATRLYCRNDQFRDAVVAREALDLQQVQHKLKRAMTEEEVAQCGVSQLRRFLEQLLQQRYLETVSYTHLTLPTTPYV